MVQPKVLSQNQLKSLTCSSRPNICCTAKSFPHYKCRVAGNSSSNYGPICSWPICVEPCRCLHFDLRCKSWTRRSERWSAGLLHCDSDCPGSNWRLKRSASCSTDCSGSATERTALSASVRHWSWSPSLWPVWWLTLD